MNNPTAVRRSPLIWTLISGLVAAAVGLSWPSPDNDSKYRFLIEELSEAHIGPGRFFRSPARPFDSGRYKRSLTTAAILVISEPDTALRQRLQAFIALGEGDLVRAADILTRISKSYPEDAEVLNDLGVIHMALGEQNASNYFMAVRLFEQSKRLTIHAPAPRYNVVLAYHQTGLRTLGVQALQEYKSVESASFWTDKLPTPPPTDAQLAADLDSTLSTGDTSGATNLFLRYLARYRKAAIDEALNPASTLDLDKIEFVLSQSENLHPDPTLAAILSPLRTASRERIVNVRRLTRQGIDAYQRGQFKMSSDFYDLAEREWEGTNSEFDKLWILLNRADTQFRNREAKSARLLVAHVVEQARLRNYKWLLGKALPTMAADPARTNKGPNLEILDEAVMTLRSIGADHDAARPMYYLAILHLLAGDFETSLQRMYETFRMTPEDDSLRLTELLSMAGLPLYRLGFEEYATAIQEESLREAEKTENPAFTSFILPTIATMYAARGNPSSARKYLELAKDTITKIEAGFEKDLNNLIVNLLCARIEAQAGNLSQAEQCVNENIQILPRLADKVPYYDVQTLVQSAEIHALQGRTDQARQEFRKAADEVEVSDLFLSAGALRGTFENERRNLYEKSIAFEHSHSGSDAAWGYIQRYRSKLFLEFLGHQDSDTRSPRDSGAQAQIQRQIPPDVQTVEYVLLPDQMLIWLVSAKQRHVAAVPVQKTVIERKVSDFLDGIQKRSDIGKEAAELHRLLIEPIEAHLDPKSALVIIPDQALHRLNFPALYSAQKKSYLIERYTILENPSLTSLLSGSSDAPTRTKAIAFGAQTDDTNASQELKGLKNYYTEIETFNGPTALKPAFLASMPNAGVFHYAGHSQDASDPLRSAILLDGNKEGANSVTAVDITKVKMPPNSVVVLASCDSSVGNSRDGVGMRGLTSAFLISGAGSVVGSLWLVESKSTSRLVLSFHKHFTQNKLPVAEALRKAQLEFIAEGSHPYYWSGFVVTGNVSALR